MTAPEVITFGCRLNICESEAMQRNALAAGLTDAVIVNTCAVTAEAARQARQAIRRIRREKPKARILVTGCAAEIDRTTFSAMPEVDHVIANAEKTRPEAFLSLCHSGASGNPAASVREPMTHPPQTLEIPDSRFRGDDKEKDSGPMGSMQRAFLEVQNGCDHRCTFCIIPFGRGASRSTPAETVIEQTRALVEEGYREVVFTGVDIASYGNDLPGKPRLGHVVRQVLSAVPELPRLRLSSLDPAALDDDLWHLLAEEPRFMPHWHLSLQAGDDLVLKRMKRRHARRDVIELCRRARRLRPDIVFGADIIAGFPTEDEAMFQNTYDLVAECGITWLHVFPYSARKGTPAARMPRVPGELRKERAARLRALGDKAAAKHMQTLIGKSFDVLVEQNGFGRTRQFAKVRLEGAAPVGEIVMAEGIAGADGETIARVMGA